MDDPLVTIAKFHSALDANLARARLEAVGIRAFVSNEMAAGYGPSGMEIGLQVLESDELDAIAVLSGEAAPAERGGRADTRPDDPFASPAAAPSGWKEREEPERCPVCEASMVEIKQASAPLRLLHFLLSLVLPIPDSALTSRGRSCGVCGYRWKSGDPGVTRVPTIDG